ncbi:acyl-CoA dehydrogenase [Epidermidibacterium keratini]|uniref:Acyl-CoA dehydrogenase n=1 Tax=Epidermidibacterium keratini TaxID=1891644 RepID=A0A7L4YLQ4_9ACTN|nr:acyl-CoA dehydrogenase family protein [Epidermidibacterium keratini]QHC00060.1 acyl-CoA dehydrogenase [Epidermidibacterium keratini]
MDLELSDVQQELASTVARLLKTNYDAGKRDAILASDEGWSRDMWGKYAELGLLGLPFSEDVGGAGMGFAEVAVVMEEFGKTLVLEPYLATVVLGGGLVNAAGTEEQKQEILSGVSEGTTLLAFAGYEPEGRWSLDSPQTKASQSGDSWTVSGEKIGVLGGDAAGYFVVSAAVDGGVGLFLVKGDDAGVTRNVATQADGLKSAAVLFKDAAAQRLGDGDASAAIAKVIDEATAAISAEAVGAMETSLTMTGEYLHTRVQFDAPIGKNQALQHRAADMYASLEGARSMALSAKLAVSGDGGPAAHKDVLAAKIVVNDAAKHISQESIQMHGGIGMTMEYPIGHFAKRLTVIQKTFDDQDGLVAALVAEGGLIEPKAWDA